MTGGGTDVTIAGGGIAGLTCAARCARDGLSVTLISSDEPGIASTAAAGMLAPTIDAAPGTAGEFARKARTIYPDFLAWVEETSAIPVPSDSNGIIEIVPPEELVRPANTSHETTLVTPGELQSLEPELKLLPSLWGLHHSEGGWIDNQVLIPALRTAVERIPSVRVVGGRVCEIRAGSDGVETVMESGASVSSDRVVLAAGAWTSRIRGLPRPLPLEPVRGQMIRASGVQVNHVVMAKEAYAVPRPRGNVLLGSTMERAGFEAETTGLGIRQIRSGISAFSAPLAKAVEVTRWAGLRPMTPDLHPILGVEPASDRVLYSCGHSRNGILLAPLSAECISALLRGVPLPADITPFSPERWGN